MTSLLRAGAGLPQVIRRDGRLLRVARWPNGSQTAQVGPVPGAPPPSADLVRAAVEGLEELGFQQVLTTALFARDRGPFDAAGFLEFEHLVLLRRPLGRLPASLPAPDVPVGTVHRRHWPALATLDRRAFAPASPLDRDGIGEALAVTPWSRVRAVGGPAGLRSPLGYAIAGRTPRAGYLQRLAVEPAERRRGLGRALVLDALRWFTLRHAREALVNTRDDNVAALSLYESLGFARQPEGLVVLARPPAIPA